MSNHIMDLKTASLIAIIVTFSPRVEGFNCSDWDKELSNDDVWMALDNDTIDVPCMNPDVVKRVLQRQDMGLAMKVVELKMSQEPLFEANTLIDEVSSWTLSQSLWGPVTDTFLSVNPESRRVKIWTALMDQARNDIIQALFPSKFSAKSLQLCSSTAAAAAAAETTLKSCIPRKVFEGSQQQTEDLAQKVFASQVFNSYTLAMQKSLYNLFNSVTDQVAIEIDSKVAAPILASLEPSVKGQVLHGPRMVTTNAPVLVMLKNSAPTPLPNNFYQSATRFTWNVAEVISKFSPGLFDYSAAVRRIIDSIISGEREQDRNDAGQNNLVEEVLFSLFSQDMLRRG